MPFPPDPAGEENKGRWPRKEEEEEKKEKEKVLQQR